MQKQPDVGDDPDRLRGTAVPELRDDRRIDVDADDPDMRRQHVPDPDAV